MGNMGNSIRCPELCPKPDSTQVFTSLHDYPCRTLGDLTLRKGDKLEVIAETTHWLYVRRTREEGHTEKQSGDEANIPDPEQGYVPRIFVRPLHSLEAQPWYFESVTTRLEAKRCLLRPENSEGAFLVSKRRDNHKYFLSVKSGTVARHYKIQEGEGGMYFLVKRKKFQNIIELVKSYSRDPDGLCCRLEQPCIQLDCPTVATLSYEEQWEVERTTLMWVDRLGSGEFGEVWSGLWNTTTPVAIKQFKELSEDILREIEIMKGLHHKRLLRLYGVVTTGEPVCIITELMINGSLSKFLKEHRQIGDIPFTLMLDFAVQVSEGMEYLETKKIVHRDLRADNILLTEMLSCKIADFGLSQFTFAGDEKVFKDTKVPLKWMAPEIFRGEPYTSKSDVWSFGILLMEIITYGEEPYLVFIQCVCMLTELTTAMVVKSLVKGYRMPCPPSCPADFYDIMDLCWRPEPWLRPAFLSIIHRLTTLAPESLTALE
ncbi:tyrosine-protein kinase Src42A isoform X1 [Osmerus mordax]|uniref:tyrosine-protein kinase Src42A isoform X1 n=1 Tax=Osmerus mordax TaxID=8014 RepID=UPI00350F1D14